MEHRSEQIDQLAIALAKAQSEMPTAALSNDNPFFKSKYAGLAEIVKASRPVLTKNGLSVVQQILPGNDSPHVLQTVLLHASGQWIASVMNITPLKTDIQSFGSYVSYLRRYSYAALVGVVATDEDDDGESAMEDVRKPNFTQKAKEQPINESYAEEKITKEQLEEINYELASYPRLAEDILKKMNISTFSDLKKSYFRATMIRVRELIRLENTTKKLEV